MKVKDIFSYLNKNKYFYSFVKNPSLLKIYFSLNLSQIKFEKNLITGPFFVKKKDEFQMFFIPNKYEVTLNYGNLKEVKKTRNIYNLDLKDFTTNDFSSSNIDLSFLIKVFFLLCLFLNFSFLNLLEKIKED